MADRTQGRDRPLSGDDLYGDQVNLRRYRDAARAEHRRFRTLEERDENGGLPFVDRLSEYDRFDEDLTSDNGRENRTRATQGGYAYATHRDTPPPEEVYADRNLRGPHPHVPDHRGRGPKNQRSDQRIHEEVCERLTDHDRIDASEIEVSVKDGEVTLSGRLRSRNAKRLVTDVVDSISGVRDVHNNIRVEDEQHWPPRQ